MLSVRNKFVAFALAASTVMQPLSVLAETLPAALAKAYVKNSQLNSARAGVRVTDEGVAIAKSGYRPTIAAVSTLNYASQAGTRLTTGSFGVQINQMLFDGFQTTNNVAAAEAQVRASNESLRNTEQNILLSAATAYMDVIRDQRVAALTAQNLAFLAEQVRAAQSRRDVGEGTLTDVAQAEASRASAAAQAAAAKAQALGSAAIYRQVIGDEPKNLKVPGPAKGLPKSLDSAISVGLAQHPAILATEHLVDAAAFAVKSAEGALLPQLSASAGLSRNYSERHGTQNNGLPGVSSDTTNSASIGATLTIPLYQGGRASAQVRQSKESLGRARIEVDVSRDQVRRVVTAAWTQNGAARELVAANRQVVSAAQLALNGVIEERNVGQRTTLDVLNAQADVITAQINLANAERDVVVASYATLSAVGYLEVQRLGLAVQKYNAREHYEAVKDKWYGLRTPDGR